MKTNRFTVLVTSALSLVLLSAASGFEGKKVADAALPTSKPAEIPLESTAGVATWLEIKDCTFDMRSQFFTGLKRLQARVDAQIGELTAKRATMKGTTDTKEWDFAMKEMGNARSYLKSTGEELGKADKDTWDEQKEKVGQAWVRTQEAYDKVKSSTTT